MSGTIYGIGRSQWFDPRTSEIAIGARLYLYEANSSTPVTAYKDFGLSSGQDHPFPIEADSYGIIPGFWLADGNYRSRLTTADGAIVLFDDQNVQALGPSSGEGGGGGGVSDDQIFTTGKVDWQPTSGTRSGWVRCNGRTIGSASSSASERANADTQALFEHLWNTYSNTLCPVSTGRGLSAAADYGANKNIGVLDFRGLIPGGLADMGNSDSGILDDVAFSVGNKTTAASLCGAALHTLTLSEVPAHDHGGATGSGGAHDHDVDVEHNANSFAIGGGGPPTANSDNSGADVIYTTSEDGDHTHTISSAGSGDAHPNMPPTVLGSYYIKL